MATNKMPNVVTFPIKPRFFISLPQYSIPKPANDAFSPVHKRAILPQLQRRKGRTTYQPRLVLCNRTAKRLYPRVYLGTLQVIQKYELNNHKDRAGGPVSIIYARKYTIYAPLYQLYIPTSQSLRALHGGSTIHPHHPIRSSDITN